MTCKLLKKRMKRKRAGEDLGLVGKTVDFLLLWWGETIPCTRLALSKFPAWALKLFYLMVHWFWHNVSPILHICWSMYAWFLFFIVIYALSFGPLSGREVIQELSEREGWLRRGTFAYDGNKNLYAPDRLLPQSSEFQVRGCDPHFSQACWGGTPFS